MLNISDVISEENGLIFTVS